MGKAETSFVVTYRNPEDSKITSLRARTIKDSNLGLSFVAISDLIFDTSKTLVIDPREEKLRQRYEHTKSLHLSIYNIVSIEEVGKDHPGLYFKQDRANLVVFPSSEK